MKNIFKITFLFCFIFFANYSSLLSQEFADVDLEEEMSLFKGEIRAMPTRTPTRVVINNPEIIDVISVSAEEMLVMAKGLGTTDLMWWDSIGQHIVRVQVFTEDMGLLKQRVDALIAGLNLSDVSTRRVDREEKIMLLGTVKIAQDLERLESALSMLKGKYINLVQIKEENASIEIETMVLELQKDASIKLGFSLPITAALTEPTNSRWQTLKGMSDALFRITDWTRGAFSASLDFLVKDGKARILSQPRLVCQSGKEAELLVGGEVPIMTTATSSTGTGQGTSVEYKEYGIKFKVKPKIIKEGQIQLVLNVDVSDIGTAVTIGGTNTTALAYPLSKRTTSTQVVLGDGQTMAISGLIKQKTTEELRKFPWLGDIPILGIFFRGKTVDSGGGRGTLGDSELVVTITPHIVKEELSKTAPPVDIKENGAPREGTNLRISPQETKIPTVSEYARALTKRIQENVDYPWAAKQGNLQGSLRLGLRLGRQGQLLEINVKKSSGFGVLDENAISVVKKLAPYPEFSSEVKEEELQIDVPIIYKLN